MKTRLANQIVLFSVVVVALTSVVPAFAQEDAKGQGSTSTTSASTETVEPSIVSYAWYWKEQTQQKVTNPVDGSDAATLELKNPYCPDTSPAGSPPEEVCKPGRLPVEVRGSDYARPNKISAINVDLALVPPGSTISKLEVRLWEARDDHSKATQYNAPGHRIQACEIDGIFGDGEARLYKERPDYECTKDDATANRGSVKVGKGENQKEIFHWTLDLTAQAQEWMKKEEFFTSVMLVPSEPRDPTPQDAAWQVALAGPMEEKYGIDTTVVYEEPDLVLPTLPPPTTPPSDDFGDTGDDDSFDDPSGSSDFGSTTTTTTTGSSAPGDTPTDAAVEDPAAETDETADPTVAGDPALASDIEAPPAGLPLYVWLALLAGMVGFSMVRSVVLEKNTGIRPDGVLAQIQKLNAQRRGSAASTTAGSSPFAGVMAGLGALGGAITGAAGKIAGLISRKKG